MSIKSDSKSSENVKVKKEPKPRGRPRKYDTPEQAKEIQKMSTVEWRKQHKDQVKKYNKESYSKLKAYVTKGREAPINPRTQMGDAICCPKCRGSNLHQVKIVSEFRFCEDSDGLRTIVTPRGNDTTYQESNTMNNRRDNIYIHFTCENCDALPVLEIAQHKGSTFIEFK
jgi:predicted nucleic-acid-binding Zn-ribbon protein